MGWTAINDRFYEEHGDSYVLMSWNGVGLGSGGRQSCSFVSAKDEILGRWQTCSLFPDDALRFDDKDDAERFLAGQNARMPRPFSDSWHAIKISGIEALTGYRPNCKAALIDSEPVGRAYEAGSAPAP